MRSLLLLSVSLNLTLAGVVWHQVTRHETAVTAAKPMVQGAAQAPFLEPPPSAPRPTTILTNAFRWEMLPSNDYVQYIANLRAVGCPEKTIRDIVTAAVNRRFALRSITLPDTVPFWSCGVERESEDRARAERRRVLERQKQELLQQLFGGEGPSGLHKGKWDLYEQAISRFIIGPVGEGVAQEVMDAMKQGETAADEISSRAHGILLPEDEAALKALREQTLAAIKAVLTPAQFDEFAARTAAIGLRDNELDDFDVSASELRELSRIRIDIFGPFQGKMFDWLSSESEDEALSGLFQAKLEGFFGAARYAQLEREKDPSFRSLRHFAEHANLPSETALQVYEIKKLAEEERRRLDSDVTLAIAERQTQLAEVLETTASEVANMLGRDAFATYVNEGHGQWLTNLTRP